MKRNSANLHAVKLVHSSKQRDRIRRAATERRPVNYK